MIIAGGYRGEYALRDLYSEYGTDPIKGNVSNDRSAMTNHIHTFTSRTSGYPQAVFCSNDKYVRSLDCQTNSFVNIMSYDTVCNCAATSPNGRLRLLVGDFEGSVIADVDSGRTLEHLGGHNAHGFACAWADDDIHVATAAQDCHILVWDARNWRQPLADIACEGTYATSLSFSPVGSGKRLLIAAEAADAVNIIDAETYDSKQVLDFFGDIAGTTLSADGSELFVSNSDREFGGLMSFQRTSHGNFGHGDDSYGMNARASDRYGRRNVYDWLPEYELDYDSRVRLSAKARRRRGLALHEMFT
jgi:WD40 repeat protein